MTDISASSHTAEWPLVTDAAELRLTSIITYLLCAGIVTLPLGALVAYLKKDRARGTVYESHLANAIDAFWVSLVVGTASVPMIWLFGLGAGIEGALAVWLFSSIVPGLGSAIAARPCQRRA